MDDRDLIRAHRAGDESAFAALVDKYADRIFSFAFRLSGDREIAEDGAQDTFIKAWKGLDAFKDDRDFRAWLFSIARNAVIDILRKRRNLSFSSLSGGDDEERFEEGILDEALLQDAVADRAMTREALEGVLAELSIEDRSVVVLHDVEDMTFDEIARMTKKPLNTVKSRYRRAIIKLRDRLHQNGSSSRIIKYHP